MEKMEEIDTNSKLLDTQPDPSGQTVNANDDEAIEKGSEAISLLFGSINTAAKVAGVQSPGLEFAAQMTTAAAAADSGDKSGGPLGRGYQFITTVMKDKLSSNFAEAAAEMGSERALGYLETSLGEAAANFATSSVAVDTAVLGIGAIAAIEIVPAALAVGVGVGALWGATYLLNGSQRIIESSFNNLANAGLDFSFAVYKEINGLGAPQLDPFQ